MEPGEVSHKRADWTLIVYFALSASNGGAGVRPGILLGTTRREDESQMEACQRGNRADGTRTRLRNLGLRFWAFCEGSPSSRSTLLSAFQLGVGLLRETAKCSPAVSAFLLSR